MTIQLGGIRVNLDAKVPVPKMPGIKYETEMGLSLTAAYMREGAMLLSDNTRVFYGRSSGQVEERYLASVFGTFRTVIEEHLPVTTVCASSTRDICAMLASIRPMNESTTSSEELK